MATVFIKNVIAMDLDYESDCIFWADINTDKIMKQCLSNSSKVSLEWFHAVGTYLNG